MTPSDRRQKVAAQCASCGSVYASEQWPDGELRPIGQRAGCRCGKTDLRVVGE